MHETRRSSGSLHFLGLVALGALLCIGWITCSRVHRRRRSEHPTALPERLQTWESEGGQNQMDRSPHRQD